jgi:hypothetical protein
MTLVLACCGCEALIGADFDDATKRPAQSSDAGLDAAVEAGSCDSALPPKPPDVTGAGGDTRLSVVLHEIYFGEGKDAQGKPDYFNVGFDLDGVCSNHGQAPKCTADFPGADPTDGPHGEDNGVGRMLFEQESAFGTSIVSGEFVSKSIGQGAYAPFGFIEIDGFNSFSEDDEIEVTWSVALATQVAPSGGFVPKLDGTDPWPLADAVQTGGTAGNPIQYKSTRAYANKRRLVAYFEEAIVPLANVYFKAKKLILTADLDYDPIGQIWKLKDGLVAGYSESDELLAIVPQITTQFLGVPLCTDNASYSGTKAFICRNADHATSKLKPGEACDASSFGIHFQSVNAVPGEVGMFPPLKAKCPAATDPSTDSCTVPVK